MRACINFVFYPVSIACLQLEIDSGEVAATFEKAESANSLPFTLNGCLFMWGTYFCMGAYKHNAYIHGVLILCGCLLFRFYRPAFLVQIQIIILVTHLAVSL